MPWRPRGRFRGGGGVADVTEREARIAFNMVAEVGAVKLAGMIERWGSAAQAYERFPVSKKKDWHGDVPDLARELKRAERMGVKILTEEDDDYPASLRAIASPPLAIYVVGDVKALSKRGVAIVGTRRATAYGVDSAEGIAFGLAKAGWAVFSGLALGIDAAAHRGALAAKGVTVGILGGALDKFYPSANRELARKMADSGGAVVSEFPFGRPPDAQTFPQRNRVVSGLALGVVAVECSIKSGTLITVNRALEQGRTVMAVPGRIDAPTSAGCLKLIREGARLVTCADDVIEDVAGDVDAKASRPAARPAPAGGGNVRQPTKTARQEILPAAAVTLEESMVLKALPEGDDVHVDSLVRACKLPVAKVNSLLVQLRLKRRIKFLPGNRVALVGGVRASGSDFVV